MRYQYIPPVYNLTMEDTLTIMNLLSLHAELSTRYAWHNFSVLMEHEYVTINFNLREDERFFRRTFRKKHVEAIRRYGLLPPEL